MKSRDLNKLLLERFPSLEESFDAETSWQDGMDTGSIIVFEDVFMPYFISCYERQSSLKELEDIYRFIEECAASSDAYQRNVIEVSVIENIVSYDIKDGLSSGLLEKSKASYLETLESSSSKE